MMNVATASAFHLSPPRGGRASPLVAAEGSTYYQCPGNVFTNTITPKEAEAKGCKAMVAQQPTTIPAPKFRPAVTSSPGARSGWARRGASTGSSRVRA